MLTASKWLVLVFTLSAIGVAAYLFVLDREITHRFEGRRWSLPARVYAAPLAIYAGLAMSPNELVRELRRLGYREARNRGELGMGRYLVSGDRVRATLRPFRFADGERPALPVEVRFAAGRIEGVSGAYGPLRYARLEPPVIGSFFASHGEDRLVVAPQETPPLLIEALKAVEDRNFESHF
ncbi:MAG: penicillin-binding protein 1B, partial [Gammaproteobacteria bacterium]|nr:penicillin-binding protein 1B [Gammaproteobacteria bacterium]